MRPGPGLLEPVDVVSGVEMRLRIAEAPERERAVVARRDKAGIPGNTPPAALMTEVEPRLVQSHGSSGVSVVLDYVAPDLASVCSAQANRQ